MANRFIDLRHAVQVVHFLFCILSVGANFTSIYLCCREAKSFSRAVLLLLIADSLARGCYSFASTFWYYVQLSQL
ncbi:unnamed protein product, partial [Mesorhabditis belari]|uniref:Uncharacterized protein n=1 Tax=Mesorhabditis belari TaxID=2138241 RepID=A0AAF3F0T2_9BILA